jgi:hypothetical protein
MEFLFEIIFEEPNILFDSNKFINLRAPLLLKRDVKFNEEKFFSLR